MLPSPVTLVDLLLLRKTHEGFVFFSMRDTATSLSCFAGPSQIKTLEALLYISPIICTWILSLVYHLDRCSMHRSKDDVLDEASGAEAKHRRDFFLSYIMPCSQRSVGRCLKVGPIHMKTLDRV